MIDSTRPEESTYAHAHAGDLIQLDACTQAGGCTHPGRSCNRGWRPAVRLLADPAPCPDGCNALCCNGIDPFGHTIPVHASPARPTRVLEHGPVRRTA